MSSVNRPKPPPFTKIFGDALVKEGEPASQLLVWPLSGTDHAVCEC